MRMMFKRIFLSIEFKIVILFYVVKYFGKVSDKWPNACYVAVLLRPYGTFP